MALTTKYHRKLPEEVTLKRYALTAIGRDRPGIVASVTKVLFDEGCNIEDSSMTILEGEFAIILIMSSPKEVDAGSFRGVEDELGLSITLKEIKVDRESRGDESNYTVIVSGGDRSGIVYKTAQLLSTMGVNITNLGTQQIPGDEVDQYIMILEVFIPQEVGIFAFEDEMRSLAEELDVEIKVNPIESYDEL